MSDMPLFDKYVDASQVAAIRWAHTRSMGECGHDLEKYLELYLKYIVEEREKIEVTMASLAVSPDEFERIRNQLISMKNVGSKQSNKHRRK